MSKQKLHIYLITAVLLGIAVTMCVYQIHKGNSPPLFVSVSSGEHTERIHIWEQEKGMYYVFLPSYADLSQVHIRKDTENLVSINGISVEDSLCCDCFELDVPYELSYMDWGKSYQHKITFMRSANVAAMYIDTESGSMDYIHEKKGNEESGTLSLYSGEGNPDYEGKLISMNGRGNATWKYAEKKSYSLKLFEEADLLGMGKAQKWILLANAYDESNLRNKIVYDFAADAGLAYTPNSQWVDLYLNGEYVGLYLLCERNEVHSQRVDIVEEGSFLVSVEPENRLTAQNYAYVRTQSGQALRIHYPLEVSGDTITTMSDIWQSVENAIVAEDGIDPVSGKSWQELIDLDSWARKNLIEEIFGNYDAWTISQFFYWDGVGKIYAGPVWDFDNSMGENDAWQLQNPMSFLANHLHMKHEHGTLWIAWLYQKEDFYNKVVQLYQTEYLPLLKELLSNGIHEYAMQISQASAMNQVRWMIDEDVHTQSENIVSYMTARIDFLSNLWIDDAAYCRVCADQKRGRNCAHYAVPSGECLSELPVFENEETAIFLGWYYSETDEPFDPSAPITEDIEIYAKWEDTSDKRLKQILKLAPLGVIAAMGVVILVVDIKRNRKAGNGRWENKMN